MGKKIISVNLSEKGISQAIKEIEQYKIEMNKKLEIYRERLADEITKNAQIGFNGSLVDDVIKGGSPHSAQVDVSFSSTGNITVIVAKGEDAVWCEFGSGVYHNGSVGSSPNPYGSENGLIIGSYGLGRGKQSAWGYYDENKEIVITRGTPATMPMFKAAQAVANMSISIAREVWG